MDLVDSQGCLSNATTARAIAQIQQPVHHDLSEHKRGCKREIMMVLKRKENKTQILKMTPKFKSVGGNTE